MNTLHLGAFVPFFILVAGSPPGIGMAEMPSPASSKIQPGNFEGGTARQISSPWVTPTIVPHLGGHALEVTLGNHPYRFVKMQRKGKSFPSPPLWPLPRDHKVRGTGPARFLTSLRTATTTSRRFRRMRFARRGSKDLPIQEPVCNHREISLSSDRPEITVHAVRNNAGDHANSRMNGGRIEVRWATRSSALNGTP